MDNFPTPSKKRRFETEAQDVIVHCASDFSKKSFLKWVKGATFSPTTGVKVQVADMEYGTFHPTATCTACRSKWEESGLERAIHIVNWDLVRSRKVVEALDARLLPLGNALRAAALHGYTNGLSKALTWTLFNLVVRCGLCTKHQLQINVTCPSSSTDVGGVKIVVMEDRVEENSSSSEAEGDSVELTTNVLSLRGFPDLAMTYDLSPTTVLLVAENKKDHRLPSTWNEETCDSQLGQSLFYLFALQLRSLCHHTHPSPIMGVFMADGQFCTVVASVDRAQPHTKLKLLGTELKAISAGALGCVAEAVHAILSMEKEM